MAATKTTAKKPSFIERLKGFFPWIARCFKDMAAELKKVTWPTRKELINYSLVVLAFMVVMGIIIGVIDGAAAWLISKLINV